MTEVFDRYELELFNKYSETIQNKWFWIVIAFVVIVAFFAYAFYCTSRGYQFAGHIKLHWPKIWNMGIGCKR